MARKISFPHLHVILLCEDYGARLWPIAREQHPVCATPCEPGSKQSLLGVAVERFARYTNEPLHIVTTVRLANMVDSLLSNECKLKSDKYELLVQPTQRGSAFAVALACARIRRLDPQAVVVVARSDQNADLDEGWEHTLFDAYQVAMLDNIAVIGSSQGPKCADWTYIRKAKPFPGVADTFQVNLFSADQPAAAAQRICDMGAFWYTGICMARAALILGELNRAGDMAATQESESSHRIAETANFLAQLEPEDWLHIAAQEVIETLPNVSLDKAMLEVSKKLVVVPTMQHFSTMSSLEDLEALEPEDADRNRLVGDAVLTACRNTTVYSHASERKVVTLGLKDVMVVELDDMTLVIAKDQLKNIDDARAELERQES